MSVKRKARFRRWVFGRSRSACLRVEAETYGRIPRITAVMPRISFDSSLTSSCVRTRSLYWSRLALIGVRPLTMPSSAREMAFTLMRRYRMGWTRFLPNRYSRTTAV